MALSGKQKRALKARGQTMSAEAQLGTDGATDAFVVHLSDLLARKELVKLRLNDTDLEGEARRAAAEEVCTAVGAECVAVIGRTVLMYRANPELEPGKRVKL